MLIALLGDGRNLASSGFKIPVHADVALMFSQYGFSRIEGKFSFMQLT